MIKIRAIKHERQNPQDYTPPRVEVLELKLETGFAASMGNSATESFGDESTGSWS